jgi:Tol biopolymer transport system component/imidazolonepropionase-like amidohydrolase
VGSCKRIIPGIVAAACATLSAVLPAMTLAAAPITLQLSEGTSIAAALSPDRAQIVFDLQGVLFKMPAAGGKAVPITDALFDARQPTWSPDGSAVAFQSNRDGHWKIWLVGANGEHPHALSSDPFDEREPSWSPDGKSIAFTSTRSGKFDIWSRSLADGTVQRLSPGAGGNSRASWSPDGSQIAYLSERAAASGIYVADMQGQERQLAHIKFSGGPSIAPAGVPTWTPDGKEVIFVKFEAAQAKMMRGDEVFLEGEDFHPFRMQWLSQREYLYTADGKIKRRSLDGGESQIIPFTAPLQVRRADDYRMRAPDLTSDAARPVHGVQRAALSPDGKQVAFTALGGLWTMNIGGAPRRLTDDGPYAVIDPSWSPDGRQLAYATDRGGSLDVWTMELASGATKRITDAPGAEIRPAWSPDGKKLAYIDAFGGYQEKLHVRELEGGADQALDAAGSSPGFPSWMPDSQALLVSTYRSQSETQAYLIGGDNQAAIVPIDGGAARELVLAKGRSIGNRSGDGPVVSPDGKLLVYQLDSALWVQSTAQNGGEFEQPRKLADLITTGQSWSADAQRLLVNAGSILRLFDMKTGRSQPVPLKLTWRLQREEGVTTIRAGLLVDGIAEAARADVDIVVANGRIRSIEPHGTRAPEGRYVDAVKLTIIPGLMDTHSHLIKEFGATYGRLNLAYGITTVRSPGNVPGDALEEKEALGAGQRPGPNMLVTGYILDGDQTMWEMGTPITSAAEVGRQIQLAKDLGYDVIKSYMHTSEPLRAEMVAQAHRAGIPITGHDIYPAAFLGMDSSEHFFVAGSGRGYSGKVSNLQHVYDDVVQILSKSGMSNAPTLSLFTPSAEFIDHDPAIAKARWGLQPSWVRNGPQYSSGDVPGGDVMLANVRASLAKLHAAGARLVVGTDTPLKTTGISTQNELVQMVKAGISPYHALRAATVVPAQVLGIARDLGSVEPGKIADLVFVEGNPLTDIRDASKVRKVMKAGRLYDIDELTTFPVAAGVTASR